MVLQRQHAVVPHHPDHVDAVPGQGVELHPREPERAISQQEHHLAVGVGQLGRQGVSRPRSEAPEGAAIHPAAGLVRVDRPARVGVEGAAVAHDHRVPVQQPGQLPEHAHRMQRRAIVLELLALGRPLLGLAPAQRPQPPRAVTSAGPLAQRVKGGRQRPVELGRHRTRMDVHRFGNVGHHDLGLLSKCPAEPQPEVHRGSDQEGHVGLPQPLRARPREEVVVVGREAAAGEAVQEHRNPGLLGQRRERCLAPPPVQVRSRDDHGAFGVAQQLHGAVDLSWRRRRRAGPARMPVRALRRAAPRSRGHPAGSRGRRGPSGALARARRRRPRARVSPRLRRAVAAIFTSGRYERGGGRSPARARPAPASGCGSAAPTPAPPSRW